MTWSEKNSQKEATVPERASDEDRGSWLEEGFVQDWLAQDQLKTLLDFPRQLTAAVVALEQPPDMVVDIASGPGTYLGLLLDAFPQARGVWTDASEPMREVARENLASFGDRVQFEILDMRDLGRGALPVADVIVSSRAAHHLDSAALLDFYRACFQGLRPGGWLANLDHTEPPARWDARYKTIRKAAKRAQENQERRRQLPRHRHDQPRPTIATHLETLTRAGFDDVELVWKAYHTCLFMARRSGEPGRP
jgi:SAM-dependent methyltransferase